MSQKKQNHCVKIDPNILHQRIASDDEQIRAKAVRFLCPCHAGWQAFEENLSIVMQLTHDPSPTVRANALHVFEDAGEMEGEGITTHPSMVTNEMVKTKRKSRFRLDPDEIYCKKEDKSHRLKHANRVQHNRKSPSFGRKSE